jgi:putative ABC transport system permease protein
VSEQPGMSARIRIWLSGLGGTGATATAMLGLLVIGCVFVATAGPRASLGIRTRALQHTVAGTPPASNTVVASSSWQNFTGAMLNGAFASGPSSASVTSDQMTGVRDRLGTDLRRDGLPVDQGAAWSGMYSAFTGVAGVGPRAQSSAPPQMEIMYRDTLQANTRLVAGNYPDKVFPQHNDLGVAVTQATAWRFGLHPGSVITVTASDTGPPASLEVTGVLAPKDPGSSFWSADPVAAVPALNTGPGVPPAMWWVGAVFVDADEVAAMQSDFAALNLQLEWQIPLNLTHLDADQAPGVLAGLNRATTQTMAMPPGLSPTATTLTIGSGDISVLDTFLTAQAAVEAVLSLLFVGLAVIGVVVLLLASRMVVARRAVEYTLLRARGASLRQLALRTLAGTAVAVIPAAVAGAGIAILLTPGGASTLAPWLGGVTVLVALFGPALIAVVRYRPVRRSRAGHPGAGWRASARLAASRRAVAELTLVLLAVGGLAVLRAQGLPAGGLNVYASAAPVLVAIPAALVVMRVYPLVVRVVARLSARRAGVTGFLASARASRAAAGSVLPAFALVLALTLAAFAGMVRDTVDHGEASASWQAAGADAVVTNTNASLTPAAIRAMAAVPGVRHAVPAAVLSRTMPNGDAVTVIVVNPGSYAALSASTPWPVLPAQKLARPGGSGGVAPILASAPAAKALGTGVAQLSNGEANAAVRVAGVLPGTGTPALPGGGAFIVLPSWAAAAATPAAPNTLLITGPDLDGARLTAVVAQDAPRSKVTLRSAVLAALGNSPLPRGAYLSFGAGLAAAAGFSVVILLLDLALGAREREQTLARLATMGLGPGQARRLTLLETLPAVLAAAIAGVASAWALAPLTGSVLNLSVFTGSSASVPVKPDFVALGLPVLGLVVLAIVVLLAEIRAARRRGVTGSLRLGQ